MHFTFYLQNMLIPFSPLIRGLCRCILQASPCHASPASSITSYALRVCPGEDLHDKLVSFVRENQLRAAFVMTCCGSLTKADLRFAKKDGKDVKETDPSKCLHNMVRRLGAYILVLIDRWLYTFKHFCFQFADSNFTKSPQCST